MALGRMTIPATIKRDTVTKDADGFATTPTATELASVRVWREGRHGSARWANLATFSEATDLFRLRRVQNVEFRTGDYIVIGNDRWDIESVELVKGHGIYIEMLATKVTPAATLSGLVGEVPTPTPTQEAQNG